MPNSIADDEVKDRLDQILGDCINDTTEYSGSDKIYYLPSRDQFQELLGKYQRDILPGLLAHSDSGSCKCDNFARAFKVHADSCAMDKGLDHDWCVGQGRGFFAWADCGNEYHACNWVILEDGHFWWVEPQDATCHYPNECSATLKYMGFL